MSHNNTIVAQATPPGRGGIGIIRISGTNANCIAKELLGKLPVPRYAEYLPFKDVDGTILDHGIALWFPKPSSFTGEDVLELHCHGGPVVLNLLLKRILALKIVRTANPGEFSERAFLNGKLDLVQAEAVADLINASSERAARYAMKYLQGSFSTHINHLEELLTRLSVYVEAVINFPDEEISYLSDKEIEAQLNNIILHLNILRKEAKQVNLLREGIKVVITGPPNVGKSSLMNALIGREVAIVTDIAGTTRDVLHEHIYIDGVPLHIVDTAGICNTNDKIEYIGIKKAWQELKQADLVLFMIDDTTTKDVFQTEIWSNLNNHISSNTPIILIYSKADITGNPIGLNHINNHFFIRLSSHTREGIDTLLNYLKQSISSDYNIEGNLIMRHRHIQMLEKVSVHIEQCKTQLLNNLFNKDFFFEELRLARQSLNEITGKSKSDNLLSEIFSRFCIGK